MSSLLLLISFGMICVVVIWSLRNDDPKWQRRTRGFLAMPATDREAEEAGAAEGPAAPGGERFRASPRSPKR